MGRKRKDVDWSVLKGASSKPKRLHLEKDGEGFYPCPLSNCEFDNYKTQRGCRKHVKSRHGWFLYFDNKPDLETTPEKEVQEQSLDSKLITVNLPTFSLSSKIGEEFLKWLTGSGGCNKNPRQAQQCARRGFKFLKFCCEDEDELSIDVIDFSICSPSLLFKFVDAMQEDWKLGYAGRLGYLDAISELIDFRKVNSPSLEVLQSVAMTEVHLKKARRNISKMMRLQWLQDLDIETLETKGHWASIDELLDVITHHLPRFENITKLCQTSPSEVTASQLSFATRFVATYLFIKVKGSRPMIYQYLTLKMIENAKSNGGFVEQKAFKTAGKYGFDSLVLTEPSLRILDAYISSVRPLLKPNCEYVLVTRNGGQYSKLCNLMSKLVYEAIGKYVHPTRYRQILETESSNILNPDEQEVISEDQKHSSAVAKIHYKKQRSREVAAKAFECVSKLQGDKGTSLDESVMSTITVENQSAASSECQEQKPTVAQELPETSAKQDTATPTEQVGDSSHKQKVNKHFKQSTQPLRFTEDEDKNLKKGLKTHGFGHWKAMLQDPHLRFQEGRKPDSLKKRAVAKFMRK